MSFHLKILNIFRVDFSVFFICFILQLRLQPFLFSFLNFLFRSHFLILCMLQEHYVCSSTVWSFGVTLWEILNLARDMPYPHLTDEQVIQNAENLYYGGQLQVPIYHMCTLRVKSVFY